MEPWPNRVRPRDGSQRADLPSGRERELAAARDARRPLGGFGMSFEVSPFVVSFCARCDKSGQWLHYGRDGGGVAIGFAPTLAEAVSYDLRRVAYGIDSQRLRMERLVDPPVPMTVREEAGGN